MLAIIMALLSVTPTFGKVRFGERERIEAGGLPALKNTARSGIHGGEHPRILSKNPYLAKGLDLLGSGKSTLNGQVFG
ncbi:hypothetical protein CEK71_02725 [Methylovulum psychrotolerans]|uniref:Uncharacterized protein n=1 Tax=Methylovulum psychrotolerans TaxID=1704499 RepID=A0A1Z4BUY6_9GAMM|nr:hypothetical protein CEK71_02725 [Methylovulum psychrotolerans]